MTFRGRALVILATLVSLTPRVATNQEPGVLHVKVFLLDAERKAMPVPRHALLISDNPASGPPRRILTALDGTFEVRLSPGSYIVESDRPFAFEGRGYQWTQLVDVVAGRASTLALTADNAEVAPFGAETTSPGPPRAAAPSSLLEQWQGSVIEVWTPTAHASGFVIDPNGLIVTNQRLIGTATSVEVQVASDVKVAARILAADPIRDVAVLWIDKATVASVRPVPLGCGQQATPSIAKGQEIVAIEAPLGLQKDTTSGSVESVVAYAILSDLTLDDGTEGGPVFTLDGGFVGITSVVESERRRDFRVVRQGAVCEVVASAEKAMRDAAPPIATRLPVEPLKPYPVDTFEEAVARRAGNLNPYQIASSDFDMSFFTPVLSYAAQERFKQWSRPSAGGGARGGGTQMAVGRAPMDFGNWSEYVATFPPVLLIRVTPKLVESFWAKVARGAAQTQGVSLPPLKRFKSGFSTMRAFCGEAEITPIHPFKLEHRVSASEAIYEGLYVFDPGALTPDCASVKLVVYAEKDPEKGVIQVIDAKLVQQIWQDFASYRAPK